MQQPNSTQCSMCFLPYDDKEHLPYDICKESHSMCFTCLSKIKNNQHSACFVCKNPIEERVNRLAQQLIKMIRMMAANGQPRPSTGNNGIRGNVDSSAEGTEPDSSMVRTAFFPNPNEFVENLNHSLPQFPTSAKVLTHPPVLVQQPHPQTQPNIQIQEHYKVVSEKLLHLQTQQNEISGKYQQMAYKNQQQPPTEQLLQLQKQHLALQQEIDKLKKYQQDLYVQLKSINPMPYSGPDQQLLFNSFGVQSGKPTSSIKQATQAQGQNSQKQIAAKRQENIVPQGAMVAPTHHGGQQPVSNKMLPTANDNKIPNLPSQHPTK